MLTRIALLSAESYYKKTDYKNALTGYDKYLAGKEATASKSVLLRAGYSAFVLNEEAKALDYLKNSLQILILLAFILLIISVQIYLKE